MCARSNRVILTKKIPALALKRNYKGLSNNNACVLEFCELWKLFLVKNKKVLLSWLVVLIFLNDKKKTHASSPLKFDNIFSNV